MNWYDTLTLFGTLTLAIVGMREEASGVDVMPDWILIPLLIAGMVRLWFVYKRLEENRPK
jgi:hypothetical protein